MAAVAAAARPRAAAAAPAAATPLLTISGTAASQASLGSAYSVTPQAADPDGDTLAFTIQNKPTWAEFNTATGALTGTPTAAATFSNIVITVSDGKATASLPAFTVTVAAAAAAGTGEDSGSGTSRRPTELPRPARTLRCPGTCRRRPIDGQTLQNLAGYRIHYGTNQNAMVNSIEVAKRGLEQLHGPEPDRRAPRTTSRCAR